MKRIILSGLLIYLTIGQATLPPVLAKPGDTPPTHSPRSTTSPAQYRDVFYLSDRFGYRFISPSGYVTTPSETEPSSQLAKPLQVLEIWEQSEFLNRQSLPETPPIISITVYNNPQKLPLQRWKGELSRNDDRSLTVAGQPAIAYSSTGLYEYDNVLVSSPEGRRVFRLRVGYREAKAPIRQVFQELVSNFTFDVTPNPKVRPQWQINYSRLQSLLTAQNWQAADLETRAILQRLALPKDFLFDSASVLSQLPSQDLNTLDALWSQASGGQFGFRAQKRIWQQVVKNPKNKAQVERFAQQVGWRRTRPLEDNHPLGLELSGSGWRLDTELNYSLSAPAGHLPWVGVSSSRLTDFLNERSLGCGSCTIDAIYLSHDRYFDYLPALFKRVK